MEMTPGQIPELPHLSSLPPFQVGEWQVSPALCRMSRRGDVTHLEPRVMSLLVCLAARPGQVFSRDALLGAVWPDVVVNEEALTRAISELRRVFADDPREPRIIETIRKSGYRLVAPVGHAGAESGRVHALPSPNPAPSRPGPPSALRVHRPRRRAWLWPALGLLLLALLGSWWNARGRIAAPLVRVLEAVPLTSYEGQERLPALSPDGARVAFAWDGGGGLAHVYVKQVGSDVPLRLTDGPTNDTSPAWAPDGNSIAFLRGEPDAGVFVVPALGGPARCLMHTGFLRPGLDWSPDGRWLAFAPVMERNVPSSIFLAAADESHKWSLTAPGLSSRGDCSPAFSPDGRWVAFVRTDSVFNDDVFVVRLAEKRPAPPRRLTSGMRNVYGLDWATDGRSVVFGAVPDGRYRLWRVDVASGQRTWLSTPSERAMRPSVALHDHRLAYEEPSLTSGIYRLRLDAHGRPLGAPESLIVSTRPESEARLSPDGRRIAFVSTRSGQREVWVCDADGRNARQVTQARGFDVRRPTWSPDGRKLAFDVEVDGLLLVHVADAAGGPVRRVVNAGTNQLTPVWSSDPDWIYFLARETEAPRVQRVRVSDGRVEDVLPDAVGVPMPTRDGRALVFVGRDGDLMSAPVNGGAARVLHAGAFRGTPRQLVPVRDGILLVQLVGERRVLTFYRYATDRVEPVLEFEPESGGNLTASADGRTLLFDRAHVACDLRLVENFR
jgi:Tol biopolymer transport system component/DNA-binding winged helix-turn-helix (wHTH) protein